MQEIFFKRYELELESGFHVTSVRVFLCRDHTTQKKTMVLFAMSELWKYT